jgi:hypothetical protein
VASLPACLDFLKAAKGAGMAEGSYTSRGWTLLPSTDSFRNAGILLASLLYNGIYRTQS